MTATLTETIKKAPVMKKPALPAIALKPAAFVRWAFPPVLGMALFILAWAMLSQFRHELPGPLST